MFDLLQCRGELHNHGRADTVGRCVAIADSQANRVGFVVVSRPLRIRLSCCLAIAAVVNIALDAARPKTNALVAAEASAAVETATAVHSATATQTATAIQTATATADEAESEAGTKLGGLRSVDRDLAALAAAGPNSKGSADAQAAADRLRKLGPELLPKLLRVMDESNAVGANWARTVFDDIAERFSMRPADGKPAVDWPVTALQSHIRDQTRTGKSRRLALRLVERLDPAFAPPWLLTCRDDPEFRTDAVDATLRAGDAAAKSGERDAAREQYRLAFVHARESDQVLLAARKLSEAGEAVDPIRHLGFVTRWYLAGPFDAPGTSGFDATFPPQDPAYRFDPTTKFAGTSPAGNGWKIHETRDRLGQTDLIQALAAAREAVGYAYAEIETPTTRTAQLRCSADDNLTVWVNGEEVLARRQWLNGTRLDRFTAVVKLRGGSNRLLVKICQGPQHADPAVPNNWSFQLRLCDDSGAGIPFTIHSPAPPAPPASSASTASPTGAPR